MWIVDNADQSGKSDSLHQKQYHNGDIDVDQISPKQEYNIQKRTPMPIWRLYGHCLWVFSLEISISE